MDHLLAGNVSGVGIDIDRVERFTAKLDDSRFLERLFSARELEDAGPGPMRAARLAARWAAKEATAKALGCGLGGKLGWQEIETVRTASGKPTIILADEAAARHDYPVFHVSISHDGDYSIAIVVLSSK